MIKISEEKIKRYQVMLLTITIMGAVLTIVLEFILTRAITVKAESADWHQPEAREELASIRRKLEVMLRRF